MIGTRMVAENTTATEAADLVAWGNTRAVQRRGKSRQVDDKMVAFLSEPAHEADEDMEMVAEALFDLARMASGAQANSEDGSGKRSLDQDGEGSEDGRLHDDETMEEDQQHGGRGARRARVSAKRQRGSSRPTAAEHRHTRPARGGRNQAGHPSQQEQGTGEEEEAAEEVDVARGGQNGYGAHGSAAARARHNAPADASQQQPQVDKGGAAPGPAPGQLAQGMPMGPMPALTLDPAMAAAMAVRSMAHLLPPGVTAKMAMGMPNGGGMPLGMPLSPWMGPGGMQLSMLPWAAAMPPGLQPFGGAALSRLMQGGVRSGIPQGPQAAAPALGLPPGGMPTPQMMMAAAAAASGMPPPHMAMLERLREGGAEVSSMGHALAAAAKAVMGTAAEPPKKPPAPEDSKGVEVHARRGGAGVRGDVPQAPAVGQAAAVAGNGRPGYKRCALHVYIAHFIADQQQQQKRQGGGGDGAHPQGDEGVRGDAAVAAAPATQQEAQVCAEVQQAQQRAGPAAGAGPQPPNEQHYPQGHTHNHHPGTGPGSQWGSHSEEGPAEAGPQAGDATQTVPDPVRDPQVIAESRVTVEARKETQHVEQEQLRKQQQSVPLAIAGAGPHTAEAAQLAPGSIWDSKAMEEMRGIMEAQKQQQQMEQEQLRKQQQQQHVPTAAAGPLPGPGWDAQYLAYIQGVIESKARAEQHDRQRRQEQQVNAPPAAAATAAAAAAGPAVSPRANTAGLQRGSPWLVEGDPPLLDSRFNGLPAAAMPLAAPQMPVAGGVPLACSGTAMGQHPNRVGHVQGAPHGPPAPLPPFPMAPHGTGAVPGMPSLSQMQAMMAGQQMAPPHPGGMWSPAMAARVKANLEALGFIRPG